LVAAVLSPEFIYGAIFVGAGIWQQVASD